MLYSSLSLQAVFTPNLIPSGSVSVISMSGTTGRLGSCMGNFHQLVVADPSTTSTVVNVHIVAFLFSSLVVADISSTRS